MSQSPFHLAIPVTNLDSTRGFYGGLLQCSEGRSAERWIDYDFFGHQLSVHLIDVAGDTAPTNPVDGDNVPARHFGVVLPWEQWTRLVEHLRTAATVFLIEPKIRFVGEPGEQATCFLLDPSGNALEFKSFKDPAQLFTR